MEGIYEKISHFIKLNISFSMKGGSGPLVEEKGISINETLLLFIFRGMELRQIAVELYVHFGAHLHLH